MFLFLSKSTKQNLSNGLYNIILNNTNYLNYKNNKLQISSSKKLEDKSIFRIKTKSNNSFYSIEHVRTNLKLTLSSSDLKLSNDKDNKEEWNFIESDGKYYLQNTNKCYLRYVQKLICDNITLSNATKLILIKIYEEVNNSEKDLDLIEKEPIDVLIKYIDLSDPTLKRGGIPQIKKDENNKELKYSIRSILKNIPWIRKIYILMPNEKVLFLKEYNLIKDKIVYVNDKDFLGYDSSNSHAFQFRYWQMERFNISQNFIVMDDDYFIGKKLNKSDFFYVENGKVVPSIIANNFLEETYRSSNFYHNFFKWRVKKTRKEQNYPFFKYSVYTTYLFIMKLLKKNLTIPNFTHNAIPCNLYDLKEIFDLVNSSQHKFSTLDSLKRHVESLQFQTFYMTYTFNKYNKKVHKISAKYIDAYNSITGNFNFSLFCINTEQKDYSKLSLEKTRIIMEYLFPEPTKYEIYNYTELPSIAYEIISEMEKEINENRNKYGKKFKEMKKEIEILKKQLKMEKFEEKKKLEEMKKFEEMKKELEKLKKQLKLLIMFIILVLFKFFNNGKNNYIN